MILNRTQKVQVALLGLAGLKYNIELKTWESDKVLNIPLTCDTSASDTEVRNRF